MKITYASKKIEKLFSDYDKLKSKLDPVWVRTIAKQITSLKAADTFGDFLALKLWHPEQLQGNDRALWSIRVSANARMILRPEGDEIMICSEVEVKGVCDYHGGKSNWYIP